MHALKQKGGATKLSHNHFWEPRFDEALRRLLQTVPESKGVLMSAPSPAPARAAAEPTPRTVAPAPPNAAPAMPTLPPWQWPTGSQVSPAVPTPPTASHRPVQRASEVHINIIRAKCVQRGIEWEDNRKKSGAFWVLMTDRNKDPGFAVMLETLGFRFAAGQGFWIK